MKNKEIKFHCLTTEEIFKLFKTSTNGLTSKEVKERIKEYGLNKLPEAKRLRKIEIFLSQFKNPLVIILLIASLICFFLKDFKDLFIILIAVFLNTLIGYFQEKKAEEAIYKLKKMVEYKAKVIRDDKERFIPGENLVPGDILIIESGDIVLADARVIESYNLETIEAVLTGESKPSRKKNKALPEKTALADRENMIYQGTVVSSGRGLAVVVATGKETEFGKIVSLIKETKEEKTPLQKKISSLAKTISLVVIILTFLIFITGLIRGQAFLEMLLTSIAIAVAAVPEGLVIAMTVCLTIGMQRVLKKKALIKKLIAAETLGSVTVIISDKTGTLTEGKMRVDKIITEDEDLVIKIGLICNNVIVENPDEKIEKLVMIGDETEKALVLIGLERGFNWKKIHQEYPRLDEIPFDSEKMWMATLNKSTHNQQLSTNNIIFIKGAPEKILKMAKYIKRGEVEEKLTEDKYQEIENKYLEMIQNGLRVLALAYKPTDKQKLLTSDINDLVFVGLVGLKDPLRKEAKEVIKECKKANIRPILVTGDHKIIAKNIAKEIGLKVEKVLDGFEIDQMDDKKLSEEIKRIDVFARAEPRHKIRIVDILQKNGEVVAMTGDGVNDAPAIKSADIGIALGSGTDVTKETADMVLLDDNFKTIVEAIKEGRGIFDNIKKIVLYLLASSFTEIILIGGSLFFGLPLPILPAQILWVNILQDGPPAMALAYEKTSKEVMKERPRSLKVPILDKQMKFLVFVIGIITNLILFALFIYLWQKTKDINYVRTMIFGGLGIGSLFYVFACKNLKKSIFQYHPFDNKFLNLSIIFGFLMLLIALYLPFFQNLLKTYPIKINDWLILIALGLINLLLIDGGKLIFKPKL
jgi:Ca2+-transporting ATPase